MRGKVSKALRRLAASNSSEGTKYHYDAVTRQVYTTGFRKLYQDLKKFHEKFTRGVKI